MPKVVDHAQRRREIASAVERIAARGDLSAISMREVAAEAGVSLGRVQHYFASKDELLLVALQHLAARVGQRVRRAVGALGPDATERSRIRVTLHQFLPFDDERRAAAVLFRAFHEGGVNNPATTGGRAAAVPRAFHDTMVRRLTAAHAAGHLRLGVDIDGEAVLYQLVVTSLGESVLHALVTAAEARRTIDYLLDRAFVE